MRDDQLHVIWIYDVAYFRIKYLHILFNFLEINIAAVCQ